MALCLLLLLGSSFSNASRERQHREFQYPSTTNSPSKPFHPLGLRMVGVTEEGLKKRLKMVNCTQESIQTTSMWVVHHRDAIDRIAQCWMDLYRNAKDNQRIALIYLMNDVVQTGGRKDGSGSIIQAFHPHVVNAFALAKGDSVKKPIRRCLEVFEQRRVFPSHVLDEMRAALLGTQPSTSNSPDQPQSPPEPTDVDGPVLILEIESFYKSEQGTEKAKEAAEGGDVDYLKSAMTERIKDKAEGKKILTEIGSSKTRLLDFLQRVEKHQNRCQKLVRLLEQASRSFKLQLRDVTIVDDAYQNFNLGIRDTRSELDAIFKRGVFPGETPPRDAPSPGADDPLLHELEFGRAAGGGNSQCQQLSNTGKQSVGSGVGGGAEDMEMDDDDAFAPPGTSSQTPQRAGGIAAANNIGRNLLQPTLRSSAELPPAGAPGSSLDPRLQRLVGRSPSMGLPRYRTDPREQQPLPPVAIPLNPTSANRRLSFGGGPHSGGNGIPFDPSTPPPLQHFSPGVLSGNFNRPRALDAPTVFFQTPAGNRGDFRSTLNNSVTGPRFPAVAPSPMTSMVANFSAIPPLGLISTPTEPVNAPPPHFTPMNLSTANTVKDPLGNWQESPTQQTADRRGRRRRFDEREQISPSNTSPSQSSSNSAEGGRDSRNGRAERRSFFSDRT